MRHEMYAVRAGPPRKRTRDRHAERRQRLAALVPYLATVRPPAQPAGDAGPGLAFHVATYNVHRWSGVAGGRRWQPELASAVIAELDVDVIALQEVLRPFDALEDPLEHIADAYGLHVAFVSTRIHRRGELGNAILSRWPITGAFVLDLTVGRLERRSAIAAQFRGAHGRVAVVATHLGLVDRSRERQVRSLLEHDQLAGPAVLLGDMNAWRRCPATRQLDREFTALHHNRNWPASFPSARPVLALDRIYARGAHVGEIRVHGSGAARRGSDHLPVVARVELQPNGGGAP